MAGKQKRVSTPFDEVDKTVSSDVQTSSLPDDALDNTPKYKEFIPVGAFKTDPDALFPEYATDGSRCFDVRACIKSKEIVYYGPLNTKGTKTPALFDPENMNYGISIESGERVLIPTGLIFDLPAGYSMMLYPRSGLSLKSGLALANCVGVIDSDYVNEVFVMLTNTSLSRVVVMHGDRVCQGEVVRNSPQTRFVHVVDPPAHKTSRKGGFGSTGTK